MNRIIRTIAALAATLMPFVCHGAQFYVAPDGSDTWSGGLASVNANRSDGPFATLGRAVEAVRTIAPGARGDSVVITLRAGVYELASGIRLTRADAAGGASITIEGANGEQAVLLGGRSITGLGPVTDAKTLRDIDPAVRDKVLCLDLKALGITEYGRLRPRGFGRPTYASHMELFLDDRPMQLARYPNEGWLTIATAPDGQNGGKFTCDSDRLKRWTAAAELWLHGYWTQDWADSYVRVAAVDPDKSLITTAEPHGVYGYTKGRRFYALNLLEELDAPGEYYIDRRAGMLYFYGGGPLDGARLCLSVLEEPLITLDDTENVTLSNLVLECTRATAIEISKGKGNVVRHCTIRNTGNAAVAISGGQANGVAACLIYNTADGAITLSGGDRTTLTGAGHYAVDNHIYDYSRWCRTYRPAISVQGVGNRAAHNHIHDAPHTAILFGGNDHVLEFNEVHDVCRETGDVGAFYTGRDWTTRGTIVRHNYFRDIHGPYTHGAMSVYLDDCASGTTIYGNIFVRASRAAFIGGGRDNIVENNIFVDCAPSVHIDARALGWAKAYAARDGSWGIYKKLYAVNYDKPPYSTRYPKLAEILDGDPAVPLGNVVEKNVSYRGRWLDLQSVKPEWVTWGENLIDGDPGFVDPSAGDYRLKPNSPAWKIGFKAIPFEKIGPQSTPGPR